MTPKLLIMGIRGIPAKHGGFETFAEKLALYLSSNGWDITVYCQEFGNESKRVSSWRGIDRVHIFVPYLGAKGTILFDLKCVLDSMKYKAPILLLGYNTFIFNILNLLIRQCVIVNMDGIEWRRSKWNMIQKVWLLMNERLSIYFSTHMIADNPHIKSHLSANTRRISMIPYGADKVSIANVELLNEFELQPERYFLLIARPEPENSILQIVQAFCNVKRKFKLVILGDYSSNTTKYKSKVLEYANEDVIFLGAIYDHEKVSTLRYYCRYYVHGHTVGGTNPSLVEALGAGSAVIANDNAFNRWVTGNNALYFKDVDNLMHIFSNVCDDEIELADLKKSSIKQFNDAFNWDIILHKYEKLLIEYCV